MTVLLGEGVLEAGGLKVLCEPVERRTAESGVSPLGSEHGSVGGVTDYSLIGREREIGTITSFLDRSLRSGGALVVSGGPGVGKSSLLEFVSALGRQQGAQVLTGSGDEVESGIKYSGVNQLLLPLLAELSESNAFDMATVRGVLGLSGVEPHPVTAAIEVSLILRACSVKRTILIVIDDLHWYDASSVQLLSSLARRLAGTRIAFIASSESGSGISTGPLGLPEYEIPPLSKDASRALIESRYPTLSSARQTQILEKALGNPLGLLELPVALRELIRSGEPSAPGVLPLTDRLRQRFGRSFHALSERTRRLLLAMALDGTGSLRLLQDLEPTALKDLEEAERSQVIRSDLALGRVHFCHPLIRSAIVESASGEERRSTHRRLSSAPSGDPDRAVWHLGESVVAPDESVAALLEPAAQRLAASGDVPMAIAALVRAADLSEGLLARRRRLSEAAYMAAGVAGDLEFAVRMMAGIPKAKSDQHQESAVARAVLLLHRDGDIESAFRLLVKGVELELLQEQPNRLMLSNAIGTLVRTCRFAERVDLWDLAFGLMHQVRDATGVECESFDLCRDFARQPVEMEERPGGSRSDVGSVADPVRITSTAASLAHLDRLYECRSGLWGVVRSGRNRRCGCACDRIPTPVGDEWISDWRLG